MPVERYTPVAAAIIPDREQRFLWIYNDKWGAFTLPMTKLRENESPGCAALRAASEAVGVPVRRVQELVDAQDERSLSGRQYREKNFTYFVHLVEPHPDFADRLYIRSPHLWLPANLAIIGAYEPLSPSSRSVMNRAAKALGLLKDAATVIVAVRRESIQGWEYLLRWHDRWGYCLPSSRPADTAEDTAKALARDELGLEPGSGVILRQRIAPPAGSFTDSNASLWESMSNLGRTLYLGEAASDLLVAEPQLIWASESAICDGTVQGHAISSETFNTLVAFGLIDPNPIEHS